MRLPSSSSLVFAALAISSSSSTLSALAAPAGDPAQAQSGVIAAHNDFRAARRGSVSLARSQADDEDETRSEEQVERRQDPVMSLLAPIVCPLPLVGGLLDSVLAPLKMTICPSTTATTASFDAESVNGDDASNSTNNDPASWSASNNTTSSVAPTTTDTPSRRDGLPVQPTTVPDKVDGAFDGVAPTGKMPVNPVDKVDGTVDGTAGTVISDAPLAAGNIVPSAPTALGTATGVVIGGAGTVAGKADPARNAADTGKEVPGTVISNSPAPAPVQDTEGSGISAVPVRRGNNERDISPPSPPVQPPVSSAPVQPPVSAAPSPSPVHPPVSAAPSPPVQPPSASTPAPTTTITSTVTETAAPTPA